MSNLVEKLEKVKARLADPKHWAKGDFAYDADGKSVLATSLTATCWCLYGAGAAEQLGSSSLSDAMDGCLIINRKDDFIRNFHESVAAFNDDADTTHEDVMTALTCAIDKAKAHGK